MVETLLFALFVIHIPSKSEGKKDQAKPQEDNRVPSTIYMEYDEIV